MLFEEALKQVGDFGLFQYMLIVYLCVFVAPLRVLPLFTHIFSLLEPPHWCRNPYLEHFNLTQEEIQNVSIPRATGGSWSKCEMYEYNWSLWEPSMPMPAFNSSSPVIPCPYGWKYDHSVIYPTIVSDMDWVCGQSWKTYVSNSLFFGSMSVGVILFGAISDKVGRAPVMIVVYIAAGAGGLLTYFSYSFPVFLVTRAIQGLVLLSISIIPFVLAIEYVPAQKRMLVLTAFRFAYPLLGCCMPWVAYAIGDWRLLNAIVVVPCIVAPAVSWFIPESSRWLISKGKTKATKKIMTRIAKMNGKQVDPDVFDSLEFQGKDGKVKKSSSWEIFKMPSLRRNFLITLFLWLMSCLTYSAGQLYAATATDSPFVMSSSTNGVDILATAIALPLADKWGRRPSMVTSYIVAAVSYVAVGFLPTGERLAAFVVLMIGRFALTTAYNVGYLYAAEIYPTAIRSQALSIRQAFGSMGKFLSSQVVQLAFYSQYLPLFILGGMSFLSSIITYPLPETNNQKLPETLEDGENMKYWPKSFCPCIIKDEMHRRGSEVRGRSMSTMSAATVDSVSPH
uniref:Putative organic cation/carnitine transporter n=1 Tax=Ornithodoros turicata TaxID=34597 RepID=A0A2R5LIT4_9ACAR